MVEVAWNFKFVYETEHQIPRFFSKESLESDETLRDSLETDDILAEYHHRSKQPLHDQEKESDPDRIRVQIDLTKFDQLEVSDCESLDDPPIGIVQNCSPG